MENKIKTFKDLNAWVEGHKLVLMIYKATELFPNSTRFELTSQIQRAVISITSNIAEGFGRQSLKEKIQFYFTSLGSLYEVQNQLLIAKDLNYLRGDSYELIDNQIIVVSKLLNGLIKSLKSHTT